MGKKNSEGCLSTGKLREDREFELKYKFHFPVEVKELGTAILLLQCEEKPVLLAAAAALTKFASKSEENLGTLFDLEIIRNIMPLIEHKDLFTRRFAAKLLAEMTAIPSVSNYLLKSDYYMSHFKKVLIKEEDHFMQEFSSSILAQLTRYLYGALRLLEQCENTSFLFERIQSPDPDVIKNNLEIMYNLMQDSDGAKKVMASNEFDLKLIYQLFSSQYPEIQRLALNIIADFVTRNKDDGAQEIFRKTNGIQALLDVLETHDWQDLHSDVLKILSSAADNPTTVELLDNIGGIRKMFKFMEDTLKSKLFLEAFDVIVRLSITPNGRKLLHSYGIIDYLLGSLEGTINPEIYETSFYGIGMMSQYGPAAEDLTIANPMGNILNLLKNETLKCSIKQAAVFAIKELLKCDHQNCSSLIDIQGQHYLLWLMKQPPNKVPLDIQVMAAEALSILARNPKFRTLLTAVDTISTISTPFEITTQSSDQLKIISCNILSVLSLDETGRQAFFKTNGPKKLYNLITDMHSIPVRNAAVQLIQILCTDSITANAFIEAKYLSYMLNNRSSARIIPSWDTCIETLFNSHLSIKFAFTGRLSLHDITENGFYVLRRNVCPFPVLDDVFRFKFCPLEPIYIINCIQPQATLNENETEEARNSIKNDTAANGHILSAENVNAWLHLKFGRMQCDPHLREYVELFKCKLFAAEERDIASQPGLTNISYISSRAKMLAKFVVRQLSGTDPRNRLVDHQLEVHLQEIKDSIETSVIPIGQLRVGSYLERALLFKVIADRICLPTALVRGEYGKSWVEVAVPQVEMPMEEASFADYLEEDAPCRFIGSLSSPKESADQTKLTQRNQIKSTETIYPTKLMKPNYIVDLMNNPGDLIPIGSRRAESYCEKQLPSNVICCDNI